MPNRISSILTVLLSAQIHLSLFAQPMGGDAMNQAQTSSQIREAENKAQARNFHETGMMMYRERHFEEAEKYFIKALQSDPTHLEAKDGLVKVRAVLGHGRDIVTEQATWIERQKIIHEEELKIKLEHGIDDAKKDLELIRLKVEMLPGERLKILRQLKSQFSVSIDLSRALPSKLDIETYGTLLSEYMREVDDDILQTQSKIAAEQRAKAKEIQIHELEQNERYIQSKIKRMIEVIEVEMAQKRYLSAVKISDDVLAVDPLNKRVQKLRKKAERVRHLKADRKADELIAQEMIRTVIKIKEASIPYTDFVIYPKDWDEISNRQKRSITKTGEPEWKLKIMQMMEQMMNYDCPGLLLDQVLTQLSEITGINIVLDPSVRRDNAEEDLFIPAFRFQNMKFKHIISWVAQKSNLTWILKNDAIMVTGADTASDRLVTEIYDIQDLLAEKKQFVPLDLAQGDINAEIGIDPGVDVAPEAAGVLSSEILIQLITDTIPGRWEGAGVNLMLLPAAGQILIKNTLEVHEQVIELLETLRKSNTMQVEVDSRKLDVEKNFFRDIGVDWRGLDTGERMTVGEDPEPGFINRKDLSNVRGGIYNLLPASENAAFGFFLEHSILDEFQARILFRALEQNRSVTRLISPRIVLMNNVNGFIRLVRKRYYISGYETGGTGLQPVISDIDEGELLQVRATISSDRKYITMQVQPDFQGVEFREPVLIRGGGGGGILVAEQELPIDLPILTRVRVRTIAVIPDGGVLIIGGVAETSESKSSRGLPVISKIPLLGRLFRSDNETDSSRNSILLVHGVIIISDELEAEL